MKHAKDLTREQLEQIVTTMQNHLFLKETEAGDVFDVDKDLSGADFVEAMDLVLDQHGLAPGKGPIPISAADPVEPFIGIAVQRVKPILNWRAMPANSWSLLDACKAALYYYRAFRDSSPKGPTELEDIAAVEASILANDPGA